MCVCFQGGDHSCADPYTVRAADERPGDVRYGPAPPPPLTLHTPGFAHYSVAWSPFHNGRLAVASAANYGLVGNGRLHLASIGQAPGGAPGLALEKRCAPRAPRDPY